MRCNICGQEIIRDIEQNNPWPICRSDDYHSRCCEDCNTKYVIPMRILNCKYPIHSEPNFKDSANIGDEIVIVYLHEDPALEDYIGRRGTIESIDGIGQLHGSWGGLAVNPEVDNYIIKKE